VTPIGPAAFSGAEPIRDFEELLTDAVIADEFSGVGATFSSGANGWRVERYSAFGPDLTSEAIALGLGDRGLIHENHSHAIDFDPPVSRVGFHFGSNVDIEVPLTFYRGEAEIGTFDLVVAMDEVPFFGFEDLDGIERVEFGTEQTGAFTAQLDDLRFEREPTGSVVLIGPDEFSDEAPVLGFEALSSEAAVTD
jgi:hypothetical protein